MWTNNYEIKEFIYDNENHTFTDKNHPYNYDDQDEYEYDANLNQWKVCSSPIKY